MNSPFEGLYFHTLFDAAADALLLVDDSGHVMLANPTARQLLGYSNEELTGMAVEQLLPERLRTIHRQHRKAFYSHPEKRPMDQGKELLVLSRDGKELPVDIGLSPIKAQERTYVLVTMYDVSRRRQAEQALRASEEQLRLAKHAAGLGLFDYDLTNGTIQWDETTREFWGISAGDTITHEAYLAGIHPADRPTRQAALERAINPTGNGEYYAEYRVISRSDGITRWIAATGQAIFENGRAVRLVGMVQDISERKAIDRKLKDQRAEMESMLKQQVAAQTASAIAHELNQPLAAISAYSEVALHALNNESVASERLRRALQGSVEQAQRAGRALHELIAFLQKGELAPEPMDIDAVVEESIIIVQNESNGGFLPVLELDRALPPVLGNRRQVQKVLVNLLHNGIDAMRGAEVPNAMITLRTRIVASRSLVQVTVQDSGPGLDAETAKRIFEPFFTTKATGIGMGLAISRAIIEANGGRLWAEPDAGTGATFHFTLPLAP